MADEQSGETEPVYLTLDDILGLYGLIVGATVAEAGDHLRNRAGLESSERACRWRRSPGGDG
jgi:hypothetical protein